MTMKLENIIGHFTRDTGLTVLRIIVLAEVPAKLDCNK